MKQTSFIKTIGFLVWAILFATTISSCQNKAKVESSGHEEHTETFTCPMHPEIIRDKPGNCPICGMALVKKGGQQEALEVVNLETTLRSTDRFVISSIPTTTITNSQERIEIDALGVTAYNTKYTGSISARTSGRIEKLYLKYNFQDVRKGQRVLELYSPELLTAQQNLIFILKNDASNLALVSAAKQRLLLLGVPQEQVSRIGRTGKAVFTVPLFSNYSGHIHNIEPMKNVEEMAPVEQVTPVLNIKEGMYVEKGQTIFKVSNPAHLWVLLTIYADRQSLVKKGQRVQLTSEAESGRTINATINYVEPFFREGTKTITARVNIDNPGMHIPVGSQFRGKISAYSNAAWLPSEAVVSLGVDQAVFVKSGAGFKARRIQTGQRTNQKIQIVQGLSTTDSVAANGQFLMDSESFIKINETP
ncbi:MAG TPA: efflux RND transporter periplasmic adaptor subunit [Sphingobacteriaceae bacterium]|nr:efflux RND transporter periplasmic adaptor subunit [Sphingobacteriaceae bacterium]